MQLRPGTLALLLLLAVLRSIALTATHAAIPATSCLQLDRRACPGVAALAGGNRRQLLACCCPR
jgi:hypothetical protein